MSSPAGAGIRARPSGVAGGLRAAAPPTVRIARRDSWHAILATYSNHIIKCKSGRRELREVDCLVARRQARVGVQVPKIGPKSRRCPRASRHAAGEHRSYRRRARWSSCKLTIHRGKHSMRPAPHRWWDVPTADARTFGTAKSSHFLQQVRRSETSSQPVTQLDLCCTLTRQIAHPHIHNTGEHNARRNRQRRAWMAW